MKRFLGILCPVLVWAQSYPEVISQCEHSRILQSAEQLRSAAFESYRAAEGKQYPTLDASLSAVQLHDTPTMTFSLPMLGSMTPPPVATRKQVEGELRLTYPLFTGFAISASIEKARLAHEKAALQVSDTKRNLYLNATRLYSAAAAANAVIEAQIEAQKAIGDSYKKAKGLYDNGFLAPAGLYAIEAKRYEIDAQLSETENQKRQALNQLSYLSGTGIDDARLSETPLPIPGREEILRIALSEREDLLALAKALEMAQSDVDLARSRYYPTIALLAGLKRQGDSFELNGDGYTNADKSYAGFNASWNLFSGMSDTHTLQAAEAARLSAHTTLEDYRERIVTEIDNALLELYSTQSKLESARMQVKAAQEYANLTRGRFDNQLSSADELSRAIADLAAAKAKTANLESELFNQSAALWLRSGVVAYEEKVLGK